MKISENEKARPGPRCELTRRANAMSGRAATYTLPAQQVVRGVITDMPFSLLSWFTPRL
jgi:hypothetical protein